MATSEPTWWELFLNLNATELPQFEQSQRFAQSLEVVGRVFGCNLQLVASWIADGCPGDPGLDVQAVAKWKDERDQAEIESEVAKIRSQVAGRPRMVETLDDVGTVFGVSKTAVFKWIHSGAPPRTDSGYDLIAMADWLIDRKRGSVGRQWIELAAKHPQFVSNNAEAAEVLGIHEQTVSKWQRIGAPTRRGYDLQAIRQWIIDNREGQVLISQSRGVWQDICDTAGAILRRPPVLSDLDEDVLALTMRKFVRRELDTNEIRTRLKWCKRLAEYACIRFKRPSVELDSLPLSRRMSFDDLPQRQDVPQVPTQFEAIPAGYDKHVLEMPLVKLFEQYERERLVDGSEATSKLMMNAVRTFGRFLGRPAVVGDLRQNRVLDYLAYLIDRKQLSKASVQTHRERILALWRFAARKRWLPDFPDIPPIRVPERTPDTWSREELNRLLDEAAKLDGTFGEVPRALWWQTILMVTYDTAERIGAVRQLRFDDIRNGWITANAETRKGQTRDKRFKLRPETLENINRIRSLVGSRQKLIFDWPYCPTYIYNVFSDLLEAAGLPNNRRTKFHKIRRTTASEFEAAGGNATDLLDHSSRKITMKYLDPAVLKNVQPADLIPGLREEIKKAEATEATAEASSVTDELRRLLAKLEADETKGGKAKAG